MYAMPNMYNMCKYRYKICIFYISDTINITDVVPQILKSGHAVSITIQKLENNTKIYLINSTNQKVPTS